MLSKLASKSIYFQFIETMCSSIVQTFFHIDDVKQIGIWNIVSLRTIVGASRPSLSTMHQYSSLTI